MYNVWEYFNVQFSDTMQRFLAWSNCVLRPVIHYGYIRAVLAWKNKSSRTSLKRNSAYLYYVITENTQTFPNDCFGVWYIIIHTMWHCQSIICSHWYFLCCDQLPPIDVNALGRVGRLGSQSKISSTLWMRFKGVFFFFFFFLWFFYIVPDHDGKFPRPVNG